MRLLLMGFGNVGRRFAELLCERRYPGMLRLDPTIVGIVTARHGSAIDAAGLDPSRLLTDYGSGSLGKATVSVREAIRRSRPDVLVELSTLQVEAEGEPAASHCREALEADCHVVTANKGPLAFHARELSELARRAGKRLLYESTVMDGCPVFSLAREGLQGAQILSFEAILNSTSNFVLSWLSEGRSLEEAVQEAQRLGIAEADPSLDLAGWDSAVKVTVLVNMLMGGDIRPGQVEREGIEGVKAEDLERARQTGGCVKLLCSAHRTADGIRAWVGPRVLRHDHPLAHTGALGGALRIVTDLMTPILIQQHAPTPTDTAYGVLNDLLTISADLEC